MDEDDWAYYEDQLNLRKYRCKKNIDKEYHKQREAEIEKHQ